MSIFAPMMEVISAYMRSLDAIEALKLNSYKSGTDRVYPKIPGGTGKRSPHIFSLGMYDVKVTNAFTPFAKTTITPVIIPESPSLCLVLK